jgi:EAL domain-containing protein (putative c-di-GMP-specific phosphodiesterase class I)
VQFSSPGLVAVIEEALAATGLAPQRLQLEITETGLLKETARNMAMLRRLRELGVSLVMDDFGAGYSSLRYLRQFPFDRVKIDRSFICDLTDNPETIHFVRSIVGLCRGLNIKTTAEGVETEAQLELLRTEGCTEIQGFLLGRPGPAERVAETLNNQNAHRLFAAAGRGGARDFARNEFLGRSPYDVTDAAGETGASGAAEIENFAGSARPESPGSSLHKPAA